MITNYQQGHDAEKVAANYLKRHGYKIVELNWKTKYSEIDIIAEKEQCMHFVEVKYRSSSAQGDGLDYITPQKLKKMRLAADSWVAIYNYKYEYCLSVIAVANDYSMVLIDNAY